MTTSRRSASALSPRGALVLLIMFAVVAGLAFLLRGTGSSANTGASSSSKNSTSTSTTKRTSTSTSTKGSTSGSGGSNTVDLPSSASLKEKALAVLAVVDATGKAPSGYVGGRQYMNDGRGGTKVLPTKDSSGSRITYHEYDVNPKVQGVNRGAQRLVVGSDGSAYMTGDHYETWTKLR